MTQHVTNTLHLCQRVRDSCSYGDSSEKNVDEFTEIESGLHGEV
jgi:hypothetical protein